MRALIQRVKESLSRDLEGLTQGESVTAKTVLIKWFFIGLLAFLLVLFTLLQLSFAPDHSTLTESDAIEGLSPPEEVVEQEETKEESMFGFEDEDLPLLDATDELTLKAQIWQKLMEDDYQSAADLVYDAVYSYSFEEDSDFLAWYQDVYKVASVKNIPTENQHIILSSFKSPRFQAVFPTYTSVMTLATIVEDPDSLLPIDVKSVQVLSEEIVDPETCKGVSDYIDQMSIHFKSIYKASIAFNGEVVVAYVGIFNNGYLKLLGYYGESDHLKTDSYWESKRLDYAQNPNF